MKKYESIIEQATEPQQSNVLWLDTTSGELKSINNGIWEPVSNANSGDGENSIVQKGSNAVAFGVNSTAFGTSSTNAKDRGITEESTSEEILQEWATSDPEDDKFALTLGEGSHIEGNNNLALGDHSHAEGNGTIAGNNSAHAEGTGSKAMGKCSHAEGATYNNIDTSASADAAHAEGAGVVVKGQAAHGEGVLNVAGRTQEEAVAALADFPNLGGTTEQKVAKLIGFGSHVEGTTAQALGTSSHAEGNFTQALVNATHAEGDTTTASGEAAHSEGYKTTASGNQAHAEGYKTTASGNQAHAEGYHTEATADQSHAEGKYTKATSENAHAEGNHTTANGNASHTEGYYTVADNNVEHAEGQYNKSNKANSTFGDAGNTIHSVGIGTFSQRKNAFEIMQNGDAYLIGIGGYDGTNPATSGIKTLQESIGGGSSAIIVEGTADFDSSPTSFTPTDGHSFSEVYAAFKAGTVVLLKFTGPNGDITCNVMCGQYIMSQADTIIAQYYNISTSEILSIWWQDDA